MFKSNNIQLTILGATAIVCSKTLFFFFNDPEGANLLIVIVLAIGLFVLSLAVFKYGPFNKKLFVAVCVQILATVVMYLVM